MTSKYKSGSSCSMWTVCWDLNFAISFPLRSNSARVKNLTYNNFIKIKIIKVVSRRSFVSNVCKHSSVDSNTQLVSERHGFESLRCRTFFRASLRSQFLQLICENHVSTQTYFRTSFECQPSGKSVLQEKRAPENKEILFKIFEILAKPNHVHGADVFFIVTDKYFNLLD